MSTRELGATVDAACSDAADAPEIFLYSRRGQNGAEAEASAFLLYT